MKFIKKLEHNFGRYLNGFFYKSSTNRLKLKEIAFILRERMEKESRKEKDCICVPDEYEIYINFKDYKKLKIDKKNNSGEYFERYLTNQANLKGYIFAGRLTVKFILDEGLKTPEIRIAAGFKEENFSLQAAGAEDIGDEKENVAEETKVFEKLDVKALNCHRQNTLEAIITVKEGVDAGRTVKATDNRVNIGRRPSNELVLNDQSTSRLHAYIVAENGAHVIYDAQSLNGTYVNDKRILQKKLLCGDKIKVGDTVISYEIA